MARKPRKPRDMSEGVKILGKATVDNMLFLKRQQWTITNYALLLDAAVMALARGSGEIERVIYTLLAFAGCGFAMVCVWHTQKSLTRYYGNLFELYEEYLTVEQRRVFETQPTKPSFSHNGMFVIGLFAANAIAFAVTFYVVWYRGGIALPLSECKCAGV